MQVETLHKQQTYPIQSNTLTNLGLRNTASSSKIGILERVQSKALPMIVGATWFLPKMLSEGISNTNGERKSPPLQLSMQCAPQCTINEQVVNLLAQPGKTGDC
jgi:hypothetical protein